MSVDCFLDTNVIVYAAAGRGGESAKRKRALDLIETREFGLSAQVLQEFYVTVVHKIEIPLAPIEALEWIEQLEAFPCLPVDSGLVKVAAELSLRHRISYWDGAILAAAESLGAAVLYSEDLSHGQRYGLVQVLNPFM
ncbi:MAG TPA: PIN domain-containing protein [Thermoanaerobaculia bacterium]|nr:PIN domain-containing protein [Thermoanaerobaculia bacterium]